MFPMARSVCRNLMPQIWHSLNIQMTSAAARSFHTVQPLINNSAQQSISSSLLSPTNNIQCIPSCGLKYLAKVHRRCRDCHMMLIEGVFHNFCKAHPRHNQRARTKRPKSTWILTAVTTTKVRPW